MLPVINRSGAKDAVSVLILYLVTAVALNVSSPETERNTAFKNMSCQPIVKGGARLLTSGNAPPLIRIIFSDAVASEKTTPEIVIVGAMGTRVWPPTM